MAKQSSPANTDANLAALIAENIGQSNRVTPLISGLSLHHWQTPTDPTSYLLSPSICLIGQGKKRVFLGEDTFVFDANTFLITSIELPVVSQILEATPERPYLGLTMEMDLKVISQLMLDHPIRKDKRTYDKRRGVAVSHLPDELADAFRRLLLLLRQPDDVSALAPLIQQEIFYRLLKTEQGIHLRNIVTSGNHSHQIAQMIDWLKVHYAKTVKIDELAQEAGLSVSAFHHHFRAMTAMSPLQYIKKVRLNEARRLMLSEHLDASEAGYQVGYESPSQFSREYSRMFGAPPLRDIKKLTEIANAAST